jgi:hypothetical protein
VEEQEESKEVGDVHALELEWLIKPWEWRFNSSSSSSRKPSAIILLEDLGIWARIFSDGGMAA